jgi:hypothetical protein
LETVEDTLKGKADDVARKFQPEVGWTALIVNSIEAHALSFNTGEKVFATKGV